MTAWVIPKTDREIANWLRGLDEEALSGFIRDVDYLLEGPEWSDDHLVATVVVGAARRWRDEAIDPMQTIGTTAPEAFYAAKPDKAGTDD